MLINNRQRGFALIEVLVTAVIVAIGISGLGVLLMRAIQGTQDSAQHTQAMWIVQDFVGRIRANAIGARKGDYVLAATNASFCANSRPAQICADYFDGTPKAASNCTETPMAIFDTWVTVCGMTVRLDPNAAGYDPEDNIFDSPSEFIINPVLTSACTQNHLTRVSTSGGGLDCIQYVVTLNWDTRITDRVASNSYSMVVELN